MTMSSCGRCLADYLGRNGLRVSTAAEGHGLWAALEREPVI